MDRLSALPDEVIFHILSFLPDPKMLLQTSVLSKAWRFHWSRVPGFGFTKLIANTNQNQQIKTLFLKWRFPFFGLEKQQQQITNLPNTKNIFDDGHGYSNHEFESWIAAHYIRSLVVVLNHQLTLPPCLFRFETLLHLYIFNFGRRICTGPYLPLCIPILGLHFPKLKKLQLENVNLESDDSLAHLLKGCPVLEELMIHKMKLKTFDVISNTVTRLDMDIQNSYTVILGIPSLRYLRLRVHSSEIRLIYARSLAVDSLIEADIDLMNVSKYQLWFPITNFIRELYNVRCLTLKTRQLTDVPAHHFYESRGVRDFYNLTQLNLCTDWRLIPCFLKKSINLRVLTIHKISKCTQSWMEPQQVPECMVSNLKTVNLVDFGWSTQHEFNMVKYILKNAKELKRMEIICSPNCRLDWKLRFEAIKRVATFEIGSRICELILTLPSSCY